MLLMAASRVLRTAASCVSPNLGRVRHYLEPSGSVSAAPELERLKLQLALEKEKTAQALALKKEKAAQRAHELALEDKKAAHELALEDKKATQTLVLEDKKATQSRGLWEAVFGIKRETAQLLNLGAGGVFFVASGAYLVSAMLSNVWAHTLVAVSKSEAASQDVRAFMTNVQRACCVLPLVRLPARADAAHVATAYAWAHMLVPCVPTQGAVSPVSASVSSR